jgi:hypothetical protein
MSLRREHCDVLTDCDDRIWDTAGNNCKLVHNHIQDIVATILLTTRELYGYEDNNGMRGYVETGERVVVS